MKFDNPSMNRHDLAAALLKHSKALLIKASSVSLGAYMKGTVEEVK